MKTAIVPSVPARAGDPLGRVDILPRAFGAMRHCSSSASGGVIEDVDGNIFIDYVMSWDRSSIHARGVVKELLRADGTSFARPAC